MEKINQQYKDIKRFEEDRAKYLKKQDEIKYPGMTFTIQEEKANKIFIQQRDELIKKLSEDFWTKPYLYFDKFEDYPFYQTVKEIPKTSLFHLHTDVCVKSQWFLNILQKYKDNIWINEQGKYYYFDNEHPDDYDYKLLSKVKQEFGDDDKFDKNIVNKIQLHPEDLQCCKGKDKIWDLFLDGTVRTMNVIYHYKIFEIYLQDLLQDVVNEGLQHVDLRIIAGSIQNDKKQGIPDEDLVEIFERCANKIREQIPLFTYSLIYMGVKSMDFTITRSLETAFKISKQFQDLEVGYDLIDNEDRYKTQYDLKELLIVKYNELKKKYGSDVHYVFHCGESNNDLNTNMLDSILLGTKRIGHGILLQKQQYLKDLVIERKIGIEISLLSNLILGYIPDLRQHPAIMLHNSGVQITLSSDDPGQFRTSPINYDTFAAILAFPLNLKDIKRIQMNGIDGMLLNKDLKQKHRYYFQGRWIQFLTGYIKNNVQQ